MSPTLPTDSQERKDYPLSRGCYAYFPAALAGVARHSFKTGAKHTKGELIHIRDLSNDHDDCIERHAMDLRDMVAAIERQDPYLPPPESAEVRALLDEASALVWRAAAWSQILHETYGGAPLAPAARLSQTVKAEPAPAPSPQRAKCPELGPFSGRQCTLNANHSGCCDFPVR